MDFLNKDIAKAKLVDASLFLMAFHLLKSSIVEGVKEFFCDGIDENGLTYSDEYENKVLTTSKYKFEASLNFLIDVGAISETDSQEIQLLRDYRNKIAHDVPSCIIDNDQQIDPEKIKRAGYFLNKIDNFWGTVEADINPDFQGKDIDYDNITTLRAMIFNYIAEIVRDHDKGI